MELTDEQQSIVDSSIATAAYLGWRRYRSFFTISDARQEAHDWVLRHPKQVQELLEDGVRGTRRLRNRIIAHVAKAGRAEKAARSGYEPEDEVFYGLSTIELVLPALWDQQYRPWRPEDEAGRVKTSGRSYNEWETMVLDVGVAFTKASLTVEEIGILGMRFGDGMIYTAIAGAYQVSEATIRNRIKGSLRKLQAELGGPAPRACDPGCDCTHVGARRSISNATARAITEQGYDES